MLDLAMPGLDGFEVLARLGDDPATRDIPVFIVTSALIDDRDRPRLARAVAVMAKERLSQQTVAAMLSQVGRSNENAHVET
jgi:CheY-like chemotaxis protein